MRLSSRTIKTESHMSDGRTMLDQERPNAFEMPAVSDKAAAQIERGNRRKDLPEIRMERWLAAGEHHLLDTHQVARIPGHTGKEFDRKKIRGTVVKSVLVTKAIAAMQIADVS